MIYATEGEKEFWLGVKSGSYAVEDGGKVFAHVSSVWAVTAELDFIRGREESILFVGDRF